MTAKLGETAMQGLREQLRGRLVTRHDADYDRTRRIWNGRFDRRPGAIAICADADDVRAAVSIARAEGVRAAVRSGGHDYAGHSVCDDGLVIDVSQMDAVRVDPDRRVVHVGPGARWAAVDRATQAFGLATTGGTVSSVGVAGYTLGGGTGHLVRKYGLAVDNLLCAEVVTADGDLLTADEAQHPDLFWGLRGGSGNFGVVTSLELRLHPLGTQVLAGQVIHELDAAAGVLQGYCDSMVGAPDEVQCYAFFIRIPAIDAFPETLHNKVVLDLMMTYAGDPDEGEAVLAPLRSLGRSAMDTVAPIPYVALQQAFDAGMGPGNRWYSRASYHRTLNDSTLDLMVSRVAELPGELSMVYLEPQGGAIARVAGAATAFPHRDPSFASHVFTGWVNPADDRENMAWTRDFHQALDPGSTGGVYVNLLGGDEPDGARRAYGANYERLAEVKRTYDPANLFQMNHNVSP